MTRTVKRYGWNPQRPDHRDHQFLPTVAPHQIPESLLLDVTGIPRINQRRQGSCTAHGTAGVVMYDQKVQGEPIVIPSRAMLYYDARIPEGTIGQDSGASVRDVVAGLVKYGVCPDSEFPYDDRVYDLAPTALQYTDATKQEALVYEAVHYPHLDQALGSGFPFVFGFTVFESFESSQVAATGIVPIPQKGEQVLGGHCVWCIGKNSSYTQTLQGMPPRTKKCRNSYMDEGGPSWGDNGDFYLPQWFFDRGLCSDFWVIRRVGSGA